MVDLWYDRYNGGFVVVTFKRPWQAKNNNEVVSSRDTSSDTTSDTTSDTSWIQAGYKFGTSQGSRRSTANGLSLYIRDDGSVWKEESHVILGELRLSCHLRWLFGAQIPRFSQSSEAAVQADAQGPCFESEEVTD